MPNKKNKEADNPELVKYKRIGITYFKEITIPDKYGEMIPTLRRWSKEAIKDDHGTASDPRPYLQVARYNAFCNVPDNTEAYQQEINDCYNVYQGLSHQPKPGSCHTTIQFLKHIYRDKYEVGLDYITILYRHPKQTLPIHCLVSKERGTGKTTFFNWLQLIFQTNCIILTNESFQTGFNAHFATKLIICIDETFIDAEKRTQAERIKAMSTAGKVLLQYKGVDSEPVDFYGKLFMNSNNETDFVQIDKDEVRYFVNRVVPFEEENPQMLEQLKAEIPAFLHFLKNRTIKHPKKTRAWFAYEAIKTDALAAVIEDTKPNWQKAIDKYLRDSFQAFEVDELEITATDLFRELKEEERYISTGKIRKYFKGLGYETEAHKRYEFRSLKRFEDSDGDSLSTIQSKTGTPYIFQIKDWVKPLKKAKQKNGHQRIVQEKVRSTESNKCIPI